MNTQTKESVNQVKDVILTGLFGGLVVTMIAAAVIFYL